RRRRRLAGTVHAARGGRLGPAHPAVRRRDPDPRRVPRAPGDRRRVRGGDRPGRPRHARQGVAHPPRGPGRVPGSRQPVRGDPLPFARHRSGDAPGRARGDGVDGAGAGGHGRRPSSLPARGRAIPSRVDPDARGEAAPRQLPRAARARRAAGAVTLRDAIARLVEGRDLETDEMAAVVETILGGEATPAQIAAFLTALRMKGETVAELVGAARAMRAHAVVVPDVPAGTVDTCGTGGDGASTLNVSTAAGLVVAAAGVPVAKHGNRAVSGVVGGADVLEALGVTLVLPPAALGACLNTVGFAFLFAPALQPALRHAAAPRRELGIRTFFNLLGPLTNPARVRRQVIGVFDRRWLRPLA